MATVDALQVKALTFADKQTASMDSLRLSLTAFGGGTETSTNRGTTTSRTFIPGLGAFQFTNFPEGAVSSDQPGDGAIDLSRPADYKLPSVFARAPSEFTPSVIAPLSLGNVPEFNLAAPTPDFPDRPTLATLTAPGQTPEFTAPVLPTAPRLSLPSAPTFTQVVLPTVPNLVMPTFSSTLPIDDIVAPSTQFTFAESAYSSAMLDSLKAKLLYDLNNGGYGIEPADEAGLWARARDRELQNAETKIQEAVRQTASRGFPMPPGAMNALIAEAQQAAQANNSSLSRDIALKRAEMYVDNRKFTIQQVREVETVLIQYYGAMMERALNAAKATVEMTIAIFNARVAKFNLQLESYKAAASVYETLIRGASLQLEAYKAQVEGARMSVEVQKLRTDVYRAQLDGVQSLVNLYNSQLGAAKTLVEIEQSRLNAFRAQVEVYAAQVGAQGHVLQVYEAEIRGEVLKVQAFDAQIRAHQQQVAVFTAKADVAERDLRAKITNGQYRLDTHKTEISRYGMELEKQNFLINQSVALDGSNLRKYTVSLDTAMRNADRKLLASKATADDAFRQAEDKSKEAIAVAGLIASSFSTHENNLGNIAQTYGHLGATAMSSAIGISTAALNS